jgi:hypothetical protein
VRSDLLRAKRGAITDDELVAGRGRVEARWTLL